MTKTVCLVSHPCVRKRNLGQKHRVEGEAGRVAAMRPVESCKECKLILTARDPTVHQMQTRSGALQRELLGTQHTNQYNN